MVPGLLGAGPTRTVVGMDDQIADIKSERAIVAVRLGGAGVHWLSPKLLCL